MALGKINNILDTNISKTVVTEMTNIGKIGVNVNTIPDLKLLMHFDGANESTTFTDSATGKTFTRSGNPYISTSTAKFNQSGYFNGSSYITTGDSPDFNFADKNFTIDFWVYFNSIGVNSAFFFAQMAGSWSSCLNTCGFCFIALNAGNIYFFIGTGSSNHNILTTNKVSTSSWTHIAATRNSSTLKVFINGESGGSLDVGTTTYYNSTDPVYIGGNVYSGQPTNEYLNGYMDELRVMNGYCAWADNFTPPSVPY